MFQAKRAGFGIALTRELQLNGDVHGLFHVVSQLTAGGKAQYELTPWGTMLWFRPDPYLVEVESNCGCYWILKSCITWIWWVDKLDYLASLDSSTGNLETKFCSNWRKKCEKPTDQKGTQTFEAWAERTRIMPSTVKMNSIKKEWIWYGTCDVWYGHGLSLYHTYIISYISYYHLSLSESLSSYNIFIES